MEYIKKITCNDPGVCKKTESFLQSQQWAEFKSRFGWKPFAFLIEWEGYGVTPLLTLYRCIVPRFSFTYIPWGPELPENFPAEFRTEALEELALKLKPLIMPDNVFIRFEPPWLINEKEDALHIETTLRRASASVQPPDTVIINIDPSCEEILNNMKQKWRYNISLSGKKNVKVNCSRDIETFYKLLKETALRDGIAVHSIDYYKALFEIFGDLNLRLYIASHEDDYLAAIVVLLREKTATYLYGASSNKKRNFMAAYALQWKAIQDAKKAGCLYYDLFGIPPDDDPNHPMAGLYRFKTGFGGKIIHRTGAWDYPVKPAFYYIFYLAEKLRKKIMNLKKQKPKKNINKEAAQKLKFQDNSIETKIE
ncbi:MAG: peptidoglycan bridge formation glycyltransferase FemA/FemB family protein [Treponema sp.]|nr:peptidoglycan bridge formation glycyltransferase FemA/FemB family protein [Treponema sp.]